jgi:lambda repressor-like predicted transcriptional regulator
MWRRLAIGLVAMLAVGLATVGLVGSAWAQGDRGPGPGFGPRDGQAGPMIQTVADLLGLTPDQIRAERQAGKSLATIAAERGVDQATLVQAITGAMVARIQQSVAQMVTREGVGPREGRGPGPGPGAGARMAMLQPVADLLGLTPDQIIAERRAGKSLADIAAERGVDQATLLQGITTAARARLDGRVADGTLTREQADAMYQRIQQMAPQMITRTEMGPFGGPGPQRGPDGGPGPQRGPGGGPGQGPGRGPGGPGPSAPQTP